MKLDRKCTVREGHRGPGANPRRVQNGVRPRPLIGSRDKHFNDADYTDIHGIVRSHFFPTIVDSPTYLQGACAHGDVVTIYTADGREVMLTDTIISVG